ncbi:MAG: hypothetical protein AAF551_06045 [Bacteroidota bacterium]
MSKRNIQYSLLVFALLIVNGYLFFSKGQHTASSFDDSLFSVADTSSILSVAINVEEKTVLLEKKEVGWSLNNRYQVDPGFKDVLFSVLKRIKIKREIGDWDLPKLGSISISLSNQSLDFEFATDALGTRTFFIQNGVAYQVEVPGYRDNAANIFQLTEDQWRDRLVLDASWRTIQKLSLDRKGESLTISFNDQFFEVDGVSEIDSSAVVDYLNQFQFFQANEMISKGAFPEMDSLRETSPIAVLSIDDIKKEKPTVFKIYPALAGQSYQLMVSDKGEMMVFSLDRMKRILKTSLYFKAK